MPQSPILYAETEILPADIEWTHRDRFLFLGSCFAEEMSQRMAERLFLTLSNPLGILFNPVSILSVVERALSGRYFTEKDFFQHLEIWRSFDVHSRYAEATVDASISNANLKLGELRNSLLSANHISLTLGTAWVYVDKASSLIVGHNHRLPSHQFDRRLLTVHEVSEAIQNLVSLVREQNSGCRFLLTVSPVRHSRDGLHQNNLSKSVLLLATEQIITETTGSEYFPAYEILVDELRDYRFYDRDLAHPNALAVDYIWDRLERSRCSEETRKLAEKAFAVHLALAHRPHHVETRGYQKHLDRTRIQIEELKQLGLSVDLLMTKWSALRENREYR